MLASDSVPHAVLEFINPAQLTAQEWVIWFVLKTLGLALLDWLINAFVVNVLKPKTLPFRVLFPKVKGLAALQRIDYIYLTINQFVEYVFISHVVVYMLASPHVSRTIEGIGFFNTLPALFLLFAIDDFGYTGLHYAMHFNCLYGYIHKHHHRQILPKRGYIDAGNEHPVEQIAAQYLLWVTIQIVARITGLHVIAVFVHFVLYAALALLNHTPYDVEFNLLGFHYSVRAHEMHHRHPKCNMAQYFMFWDKLLGTYREYSDGSRPTKKTKTVEDKEE